MICSFGHTRSNCSGLRHANRVPAVDVEPLPPGFRAARTQHDRKRRSGCTLSLSVFVASIAMRAAARGTPRRAGCEKWFPGNIGPEAKRCICHRDIFRLPDSANCGLSEAGTGRSGPFHPVLNRLKQRGFSMQLQFVAALSRRASLLLGAATRAGAISGTPKAATRAAVQRRAAAAGSAVPEPVARTTVSYPDKHAPGTIVINTTGAAALSRA